MDGEAIARRFWDESEYIERYVRLVRIKSTVHDRQVRDLNRILHRVEIAGLPVRRYERTSEPYSPEELTKLLKAIRRAGPEVYRTILGHEQRLDDIPPILIDGPSGDHMDRLGEWVEYLVDNLSDDPGEDEIEAVLLHALQAAEAVEEEQDEEERVPPEALRALLAAAVDHARYVKVRQRVDAMLYARERFEEIEVMARMAAPDAEINVLRQGFILLMTAFDAAVFDLIRIAFHRKFFELIRTFGRQDKLTLEALSEAGSFDALREKIVEEQLKKRYLKDVLNIIQTLGVQCVDEIAGDCHIQLIELVLRRNLHVHNRGIADERYLEPDPATGKPKYNLFNLKPGDPAVIDDCYFEAASRLCSNCVERLVKWCDA